MTHPTCDDLRTACRRAGWKLSACYTRHAWLVEVVTMRGSARAAGPTLPETLSLTMVFAATLGAGRPTA